MHTHTCCRLCGSRPPKPAPILSRAFSWGSCWPRMRRRALQGREGGRQSLCFGFKVLRISNKCELQKRGLTFNKDMGEWRLDTFIWAIGTYLSSCVKVNKGWWNVFGKIASSIQVWHAREVKTVSNARSHHNLFLLYSHLAQQRDCGATQKHSV